MKYVCEYLNELFSNKQTFTFSFWFFIKKVLFPQHLWAFWKPYFIQHFPMLSNGHKWICCDRTTCSSCGNTYSRKCVITCQVHTLKWGFVPWKSLLTRLYTRTICSSWYVYLQKVLLYVPGMGEIVFRRSRSTVYCSPHIPTAKSYNALRR